MTKSTSRRAYDDNKEYRPNQRWRVLALFCETRRWLTSDMVIANLGGNRSNMPPRILELEDFGMLTSREIGERSNTGNAVNSYAATTFGMKVYQADNLGRYYMKALAPGMRAINDERAIALAPAKELWAGIVTGKMRVLADGMAKEILDD